MRCPRSSRCGEARDSHYGRHGVRTGLDGGLLLHVAPEPEHCGLDDDGLEHAERERDVLQLAEVEVGDAGRGPAGPELAELEPPVLERLECDNKGNEDACRLQTRSIPPGMAYRRHGCS